MTYASARNLSQSLSFSPLSSFFLRLLPIGGVMDTCEQNQKTWAFLSLFVLTLFQVLLCSTCCHYTFMMSKYDDKKSELYKTICIQQQDRCILIAAWFVVLHWDYLFIGVSNHWWKWFREWSIRFIQQPKVRQLQKWPFASGIKTSPTKPLLGFYSLIAKFQLSSFIHKKMALFSELSVHQQFLIWSRTCLGPRSIRSLMRFQKMISPPV